MPRELSMAYQSYDATYEVLYKKVLAYPKLSGSNKKAIEDYSNYLKAKSSNIKTSIKHFYCLYRFLKCYRPELDFTKADKKAIENAMAKLETLKTKTGIVIATETKRNVRVIVKAFWKYLKGEGEFYPQEVRWIKTGGNHTKKLLPQNLLNENDIIKMINATPSFRNKAIISLLYDSGIRIEELINICKKDVETEGSVGFIRVNGKTGMRRIPITFSIRYIAQYLNLNKQRKSEEPIWTAEGSWNNLNRKSDYAGIRKMLKEISIKAKINKPVNPHAFRHARATFYASKGKLSDRELMEYFGWSNPSVISTYIHLSSKNMTDTILQANGIKPIEKANKSKFEDRKCRRCDYSNTIDAIYCNKCGSPLEIPEAMNSLVFEEAVKRTMNKPQFLTDLRETIKREEAKQDKKQKQKAKVNTLELKPS